MKKSSYFLIAAIISISLNWKMTLYAAYTFNNLNFPANTTSYAYGISDNNPNPKIVGMYKTGNSARHAFVWISGSITELLPLQGYTYSAAYRININGKIVGESWDENNHRACMWNISTPQTPIDLKKLLVWHTNSVALDINDNDPPQVVGWSGTTAMNRRAFGWDETNGMRDLGALTGGTGETGGGYSVARGINNNGNIVGESYVYTTLAPYSAYRAFMLISENTPMIDLGYLPLGYSYAYAWDINNSGKIAGYSWNDSGRRACFWNASDPGNIPLPTNMNTLDDTSSDPKYTRAYAINDNDKVVGNSYLHKDYTNPEAPAVHTYKAFVWDSTGGIQNLNTITNGIPAGLTLERGTDINFAGCIVGFGTNSSGSKEAFFITP